MREYNQIPPNWESVSLGELADWRGGGTPTKSRTDFWDVGTIPWISPKDMKSFSISSAEDSITHDALIHSSAKLIPAGSVLVVTRSGILEHTLPVARTEVDVAVNQDMKALTPSDGIDPDFLAYALRRFGEEILKACRKSGTTVASVITGRLKDFRVPIPPSAEQRRVVDVLDAYSTRLEAAVAALERAQSNLKRHRASILKAACEGRLVPTEADLARREGREYEPADLLLDRILAERRSRWEAEELAKLEAKGKAPKDDRWKEKYKEPTGPDTTELPELPEGWVWASLEQLASPEGNALTDGPFGSKLKTSHYTHSGPRVIRLQNIGDGRFIDERAHISGSHFDSLEKHHVCSGDLVIASLGSEPPRSAIVPDWLGPAVVKADCIRFRPTRYLRQEYANIVLNSDTTKKRMASVVHGVGRPRLGLKNIRRIPVPLPPTPEQMRIVRACELQLMKGERLVDEFALALARATRLRQSILKRAFEGRLVSQNPDDEPASKLLERIRREKAGEARKARRVSTA